MFLLTILKNIRRKRLIKQIFNSSIVYQSVCFNNKTQLEGYNIIYGDTNICNTTLGMGTYINSRSNLSNSKIGKFCSIGSNVSCVAATHPISFVSSYPGFYNCGTDIPFGKAETSFDELLCTEKGYHCEIGNDVWIGNNVLIKGGVSIGDGAIIGMGAVVTKNVPPYAIVVGVPAKIIKYRFDKNTIEKLLEIKWWDWAVETIKERRNDFSDIGIFITKYGD